VDDLVDKIANELLSSTYLSCCPLGYIKIISWYYSNIIIVQLAILNYIVVNDNNIIMYNLPIQFIGPIRLILWSSGRPPPTFKYVLTTIMLTIEVGIVVWPTE